MKRAINRQKRKQLITFSQSVLDAYNSILVQSPELTPINFSHEIKRFLQSKQYNPQFIYKKQELPPINSLLNHLWQELLVLKLPFELESYIESLLYHFAKLHYVREHIGTNQFTSAAKQIYPFENTSLSHVIASLPQPSFADSKGAPLLNAYQIQDYIQQYVDTSSHLKIISVIVDRKNKYTIRAGFGKMYVGSDVKRNEQNVVRLIVHEIESHILQKQNLQAGSPLLFLRTQYDRELYAEGMAIYNEVSTGTITQSAYELYLHRIKAVSLYHLSFRDMYDYLSNRMDNNKALITTFRVKRGMGDTSKPGGWPKDAAYLLGYKAVNDYLETGGRVKLLYMAQVPALGELLLKYNLLPTRETTMPEFHLS
jgi:hypothetical protein